MGPREEIYGEINHQITPIWTIGALIKIIDRIARNRSDVIGFNG